MFKSSLNIGASALGSPGGAMSAASGRAASLGALSVLRSWLRREVLPWMATKSNRSGHVSRTQAVKAETANVRWGDILLMMT